MIEAGTILQNRYRVEKQIGQGGMGNVYVATDQRFKSVVAIKETIFEDANLRKAFEREARLLNSLKHAALPRVSDHFDEADGQFLVMEFIGGDDLAAMLEKSGEAFPLETVLQWAHQLCDALEYLHAQNIIHRDIKPQNLKLTQNNHIVLLDFGLAKGNATDAPHQTAAKSIFGFSRNYASLEQIQGAGTEPRSDLYSLAATVYHLLTGVPPADALTRAMNVLNAKSDPLIAADLVNRAVPTDVAEVLQKTMALNAEMRPESATAMRRMLDEADKTIDSSAINSSNDNRLTADFQMQDTKIIGAKTSFNVGTASEGETKIETKNPSGEDFYGRTANDSESKETVLRPIAAAPRPKRAKAVGAVVLSAVVLIGTGLFAAYFKTSDTLPPNVSAETTTTPSDSNTAGDKTSNADFSGSDDSGNRTVLAEKETLDNSAETLHSPIKTAKNGAPDTKRAAQNQPRTQAGKQTANPGNIVINDETIEVGDIIIDEDGIRSKKTGKSIVSDSTDQTKSLTPEQIRQLKELRKLERLNEKRENRRRNIVINPPKPPSPLPTP